MEMREENGVCEVDVQFDHETVGVITAHWGAGRNVWLKGRRAGTNSTKEGWHPSSTTGRGPFVSVEFDQTRVFTCRGEPRVLCGGHLVRNGEEVKARWVCGQEEESIEVEPVDETENGSRTLKKVQDLRQPSKEERAMHEMTHLPPRSWCRHCVRGRGMQMPHQMPRERT